MDNKWCCPNCDTTNTADKCVVCGYLKPKGEGELHTINNGQQGLKRNLTQGSLKKDFEQDQNENIIPDNGHIVDTSKKTKTAIIVGIFVVAIAVICFVFVGIFRNKNNNENLSENIPSLSALSSDTFEWVVTSDTETSLSTTVPVTEETEILSTVVPETETEQNEYELVKMPSLLGKEYSEAIRILDTMGLEYKISFSSKKYVDIGENCVFSQKPASGSDVERNSVVELGISSFKETTTQKTTMESMVDSTSDTTTISSIVNTKSSVSEHSDPTTPRIHEAIITTSKTTPATTPPTITTTTTTAKEEKIYIVRFYVHDDVIPVYVSEGDDAVPPIVESDSEYSFIRWYGNYRNVTEDRDVIALFEVNDTTTTSASTAAETTTARVGYGDGVTFLLSFNQYSLDDINVPIKGTTWKDYTWTSSNEYCVQIFSGTLQTYYEGETTITLTYIYDPSIVATTKVCVVSQIS